jgi:uncharacterized protein YmfQ (DUF2313 family)
MSDLANLGADDYHRVAVDLLPTGMAWPRDPDAVVVRAWAGPAAGLARHHARVMDLLAVEADPRSTLLLLPDWERNTGLPDECTGPAETLEGRRLRLVQQLTARGGQSPAFFIALAAGLGFEGCTITEFRPFTCSSRCTDGLDTDPWRFTWRLNVPIDAGIRGFTARSACTESIRTWGAAVLECVIRRITPAHTNVLFGYGGYSS